MFLESGALSSQTLFFFWLRLEINIISILPILGYMRPCIQAICGPALRLFAALYPRYMRPCIQAICGPVPRRDRARYPGYKRPCTQDICGPAPGLYAALYPGYMRPVPSLYAALYPGYIRPCTLATCGPGTLATVYAALYPGYMRPYLVCSPCEPLGYRGHVAMNIQLHMYPAFCIRVEAPTRLRVPQKIRHCIVINMCRVLTKWREI